MCLVGYWTLQKKILVNMKNLAVEIIQKEEKSKEEKRFKILKNVEC